MINEREEEASNHLTLVFREAMVGANRSKQVVNPPQSDT
jgi:hypothetical protein